MWKAAGMWWGLFSMTISWMRRCQAQHASLVWNSRICKVLTWPMPFFVIREIASQFSP